jgi:uncharacterized protein YyaL (SSP411 family)
MHNPVDWWPWCDEAFEAARRQDKPIFLSVGYSTCHWCHVMEHESFEDAGTAEILNRNFISVKLDREERPDLDAVYMTALQQVTGGGGWPMSILLDHDRRPFFLATYLPPTDRYGRPGFTTILMRAADLWHNRRGDLLASAEQIVEGISRTAGENPADPPDATTLAAGVAQLAQRFDPGSGGFGQRPKFPTPHVFSFLLQEAARTGSATASHMATHSLRMIARGGIHDHVGGGFHRYSTDPIWRLPHFEKMLYDQAQLAVAFLDAYAHSGDPEFADAARGIFRYVLRDMQDPSGGFHSAEDADSGGEEGRFYIFTLEELTTVLGRDHGDRVAALFQCEPGGNYAEEATGHRDGTNILHLRQDADHLDAMREAAPLLDLLLAFRASRERPRLDDKVQASWNGLLLSALVRGARVLRDAPESATPRSGDPTPGQLLTAANRLAEFLTTTMRGPQGLWHTYRAGIASVPGFLDDYAFAANGLLDLHQETLDVKWLDASVSLADEMTSLFEHRGEGGERLGMYFSPPNQADVLIRQKEIYDGAEPSGNSVAFGVLSKLGRLLGRSDYLAAADGILRAFGQRLRAYPSGHTRLMLELGHELRSPTEVTVVSNGTVAEAVQDFVNEGGALAPFPPPAANALIAAARSAAPRPLLLFVSPDNRDQVARISPSTASMKLPNGAPAAAFVCRNGSCGLPLVDPAAVTKALKSGGM